MVLPRASWVCDASDMDTTSRSILEHSSPRCFAPELACGPWRPDLRFTTRCVEVRAALHAYGPGSGSFSWRRFVAGVAGPVEETIPRHGDGYIVIALVEGDFLIARLEHGAREAALRWGRRHPNTEVRWSRAQVEQIAQDADVARLPGWSEESRGYAELLLAALPPFLGILGASSSEI